MFPKPEDTSIKALIGLTGLARGGISQGYLTSVTHRTAVLWYHLDRLGVRMNHPIRLEENTTHPHGFTVGTQSIYDYDPHSQYSDDLRIEGELVASLINGEWWLYQDNKPHEKAGPELELIFSYVL